MLLRRYHKLKTEASAEPLKTEAPADTKEAKAEEAAKAKPKKSRKSS